MTKKLYYTDPLAAAYMAREFGVVYKTVIYSDGVIDGHGDNSANGVCIDAVFTSEGETFAHDMVVKANIHPDSYSIFEPQKGDCFSWFGWRLRIWDKYRNTRTHSTIKRANHLLNVKANPGNFKIIERNKKLFFWPESEEE